MFSLKIDNGYAISFNQAANSDRIINATTLDELSAATKDIRRNGMKNLGIYSVALFSFYRYVEADKKIESIQEVDTTYRDRYFTTNPDELRPGTLTSYLVQVNSLFKYIGEQNSEGVTFSLGKTRSGRRTTSPIVLEERNMDFLEPDELKRFLEALENYKYLHENPAQVRLLMKIACFGGLRADEILSLKTTQLSFVDNPSPLLSNEPYLRINVVGKAKKLRTVYIKALMIKKDYEEHMKYRKCGGDLLFCNQYGERYDNRSPYEQLSRILKSIGIDKSGTHMLRRSYASYLMANNVDYAVISELLGHESEEMTDLYVKITKAGLRKIVKYWEDF
jgi:site-specific recombinase XerD